MFFECLILAALAALLGGQINRAIYRFAWNQRWISPWSKSPESVPPRKWSDCIPVLGWWFLRRENRWHGAGFWIRPMLLELAFVAGVVWLYTFELGQGLYPIGASPAPVGDLRWQFVRHLCLIICMVAATFIDLDEKTIPDEVTLSGTLVALGLSWWAPVSLLPSWSDTTRPIEVSTLWLTAPQDWHPVWDGTSGLLVAIACLLGWWYAVLPKTLWYRSGVLKFGAYLLVSIWRQTWSWWLSLAAVLLGLATWAVWSAGGPPWQALLTAWVGLAAGGAIVWSVRVVGTLALGQEAMGFGDVTLLAMIGAFLGWQTSLLVFFLAPFAGVLIAVAQWLLTGRKDIAYGPFLCLAALIVLLGWPAIWTGWGLPIFHLGWFVPVGMVFLVGLLGGMLLVVHTLRTVIMGPHDESGEGRTG